MAKKEADLNEYKKLLKELEEKAESERKKLAEKLKKEIEEVIKKSKDQNGTME